MLALQMPQQDAPGWLADLIKFAAIFFFIGLPILRSIRESIKKRADAGDGTKTKELDDSAREGRQAWEDLLRGELPDEPAPTPETPSVPPVPAKVTPPPLPASARASTFGSSETGAMPAPMLGGPRDFHSDPFGTALNAEREPQDEEAMAERVLAERHSQSLERQIDRSRQREDLGSSFERAPEAYERTNDATPAAARTASDAQAPASPSERRSLRAGARARWRRAVVMSEILSGPTSERDPSDRSRPAAFRP